MVVYLCVAPGAGAHVGSLGLASIRFNDKLKTYVAAGGMTWRSLRWVAVALLYVPITVVVASLWGAGSFEELGTALLAGYSAE